MNVQAALFCATESDESRIISPIKYDSTSQNHKLVFILMSGAKNNTILKISSMMHVLSEAEVILVSLSIILH